LLIHNKRIVSLQFLTFFNFKEGIMQVRKIMTKNPACCTSDSTLQEVAHMMEMYDCGCIPVVEDHQSKRPIGTITDRDITVRTFSRGNNPLEMKASDIMTTDIATVTPGTDVYQCLNTMEEKQIRRILVVDKDGRCVGIVAQADIAEHATNNHETVDFLREVSESDSDRARERRFESNRFENNERRTYRQNNRSFSQNEPPAPPPRQMYRQSYSEKESFSNGKMLLTLLGSIGLGAGLSYYFGSAEETKRRPHINQKFKMNQPDTKITIEKKTTHSTANPQPTSALNETSLSDSQTGLTGNRDTISGTVSSFNRTNDDDDLKPITEIGRTATNS
jgi:CBS domain-containing protein